MTFKEYDRLDYLNRTDLPEAEFLSTATTGEDVGITALSRSWVARSCSPAIGAGACGPSRGGRP